MASEPFAPPYWKLGVCVMSAVGRAALASAGAAAFFAGAVPLGGETIFWMSARRYVVVALALPRPWARR